MSEAQPLFTACYPAKILLSSPITIHIKPDLAILLHSQSLQRFNPAVCIDERQPHIYDHLHSSWPPQTLPSTSLPQRLLQSIYTAPTFRPPVPSPTRPQSQLPGIVKQFRWADAVDKRVKTPREVNERFRKRRRVKGAIK